MREFDLINQYFKLPDQAPRADVIVGIGDDAAITAPQPGNLLVTAIDTLVAGRHFPEDAPADSVGHKALAVNLSDLAAMGAEPCWATLAITLPEINEPWIAQFMHGFSQLAQQHRITLIGGDTTQGPLTITVQVTGQMAGDRITHTTINSPNTTPPKALTRHDAQPGDQLYVSGQIGNGALGLRQYMSPSSTPTTDRITHVAKQAFLYPQPRVALGQALNGIANACIDVSDGLLADIEHMLAASQVGACVDLSAVPYADPAGDQSLQLNGGDDYELCFTVPTCHIAKLTPLLTNDRFGTTFTHIGTITAAPTFIDQHNQPIQTAGYQHFT